MLIAALRDDDELRRPASLARSGSHSMPVRRCRRSVDAMESCRSDRRRALRWCRPGVDETSPLATDCHFQAKRSGNIGVPIPAPS